MQDRPAPDPAKLLAQWMEWETGESTPGRVMANLKTSGMRELLESLADPGSSEVSEVLDADAAASWTPIV